MGTRVHRAIVVRVQPRASEGITDLLSASGYKHLVEDKVLDPTEKHMRHSQVADTPTPRGGQRLRTPYKRERRLLDGKDLARYRNQADKSLHQPGTAMHHFPSYRESASTCLVLSTC